MSEKKKGEIVQFPKTVRRDLPADEDALHLNAYTQGLSDFISTCPTPMTVSLQGSWGSGKSSMMKLLEKNLGEEALCISFNTWQYSQFDLGEQLPLLFVQSLIETLGKTDEQIEAEKATEVKELYRAAATFVGTLLVRHFGLEDVVKEAKGAFLGLKKPPKKPSLTEALEGLRTSFGDLVKARLEQEGKNRVIFFIDDLDRLPPARAVELMEVLKTVLECDRCVFVLAIDYEVVIRGVKDKYGENFGAEKGRSFFDKMIQLPFDLPVEQYQMGDFLEGLIGEIGNRNCANALLGMDPRFPDMEGYPDDRQYVEDMAVLAVGRNPRSLKRFFNSFALLSQVAAACRQETEDSWHRQYVLLFGVVALKTAYPRLYDYLMEICHDGLALRDFYSWFHTDQGWEELQTNRPALAASLGLSGLSPAARERVRGLVRRFFQMGLLDWVKVDPLNKFNLEERIQGQEGFPLPIQSWQTLEVVLEASSAHDFSKNQLLLFDGDDQFVVLVSALRYLTDRLKLGDGPLVTPQLLSRCWKQLIIDGQSREGLVVMTPILDASGLQGGMCLTDCTFTESAFWALLTKQTSPKAFRELVSRAFLCKEEENVALKELTDRIEATLAFPSLATPSSPFDTEENRRLTIGQYFTPPLQ